MNLVRWDPFRELEWMHARLNRMFSERPFRGADETELSFADWAPAADVQETEKEYVIKADLPDVKKDDVKVEYDDGVDAAWTNLLERAMKPKGTTPYR